MKRQDKGMKKQRGNIIAGILVLVAIIGVIAAYMMSGNTNTSSASTATGGVLGAALTGDGNAIQQTFQTLTVNGSAASSITFIPAGAGTSNILNPTTGIQLPIPNANAVINTTFPNGAWIYNSTGFKGNAIGTAAVDQAVFAIGVKDGVCQQINSRLYGSTTIPASGLANTVFTSGAAAATPTGTGTPDLSAVAGIVGWMAGCVTTTAGADNNVYFQVMQAN